MPAVRAISDRHIRRTSSNLFSPGLPPPPFPAPLAPPRMTHLRQRACRGRQGVHGLYV